MHRFTYSTFKALSRMLVLEHLLLTWACLSLKASQSWPMLIFASVLSQQPWRLHQHRNISVSLRSSEPTEPADAGQRAAGRSFWSTLLMCVRLKTLVGLFHEVTSWRTWPSCFCKCFVLNVISFLLFFWSQFQSTFDGNLYLSCWFSIFFVT